MKNKNSDDFMSAKEAAAYLRLSLPTLYNLRATDKTFPRHKVGEKLVFIREELRQWLLSK